MPAISSPPSAKPQITGSQRYCHALTRRCTDTLYSTGAPLAAGVITTAALTGTDGSCPGPGVKTRQNRVSPGAVPVLGFAHGPEVDGFPPMAASGLLVTRAKAGGPGLT